MEEHRDPLVKEPHTVAQVAGAKALVGLAWPIVLGRQLLELLLVALEVKA